MGYFKKNGYLPFSEPLVGREELNAVKRVFNRNWFTSGPEVKEFEKEFSNLIGSKFSVAVNSATAALHVSLATIGIKKGDDVISTPFTFVSTINTIVETGAYPVLVDIDEKDYNISADKIIEKIEREYIFNEKFPIHKKRKTKLKAILPVHYAGQPADLERINDIARKYNLKVIEDAAHAIGSKYKGKNIGDSENLVAFSFYSNKNITTGGEGGIISSNNEDYERKLRLYSLHGIDKEAYSRLKHEGLPFYDVKVLGFKYNMTDISAAIGREQLKKIVKINNKRKQIAELYKEKFSDMDEIIIKPVSKDKESSYHLFVIEILNYERNKLIKELLNRKIQTSVHFIPVHLFSYYKNNFPYKKGDFPVSEKIFNRILSLPIFPAMDEDDVKIVVEAIKEILAKK